MKRCIKCELEKELSEFHKNKASKDGRVNKCKSCANEEARLWRNKNTERNREIQLRWREKNRESESMRVRDWQKENPEKCREYNKKRYTQKKATQVEEIDRFKVFERDGWICQLCREEIPQDLEPHEWRDPLYPNTDHVVPLSKGGLHTYSNIQAVHRKCNAAKAAKVEMS